MNVRIYVRNVSQLILQELNKVNTRGQFKASKALYDATYGYTEEQEAFHGTLQILLSTADKLLQTEAMRTSETLLDVHQELSLLLGKYATRQRRVEARGVVTSPTTTPSNIPATTPSNIPATTPASVPQTVTFIPTNLPLSRSFSAVASKPSTSRAAIQREAQQKAAEEKRLCEAEEAKRLSQIQQLDSYHGAERNGRRKKRFGSHKDVKIRSNRSSPSFGCILPDAIRRRKTVMTVSQSF